jgi:large subunit ribosomal protein L32
MGLPGHRRTSSHKHRRAAHFALKPSQLTICAKCQKPVRPHYACAFCGTYQGRAAAKIKAVKKTSK